MDHMIRAVKNLTCSDYCLDELFGFDKSAWRMCGHWKHKVKLYQRPDSEIWNDKVIDEVPRYQCVKVYWRPKVDEVNLACGQNKPKRLSAVKDDHTIEKIVINTTGIAQVCPEYRPIRKFLPVNAWDIFSDERIHFVTEKFNTVAIMILLLDIWRNFKDYFKYASH